MKITSSSNTVKAYENRHKTMNLHFHPILAFREFYPFSASSFKNYNWSIKSEHFKTLYFNSVRMSDSPLKIKNDKTCVEFFIKLKNAPFVYDDYECDISFSGIIEEPIFGRINIKYDSWGVVRTIWSKGLQ